jgi:hypothetical protein
MKPIGSDTRAGTGAGLAPRRRHAPQIATSPTNRAAGEDRERPAVRGGCRANHEAEERLQPALAGRAVAVARALAGAVVALQPGVEMLGEGLARDPELTTLGADLHPRAELRGRARAAEAALLTLAPVAACV